MLETESFAKVKAGGLMDCFVYDPANPPAPRKKVVPAPEAPAARPAQVGVETFGGRLFAGSALEDAKGVEKLLSGDLKAPVANVPSAVEFLLRLKKDIQELKEDAGKAPVPSDPLSKVRHVEQVLNPVLADERVEPFLPHISPSLVTLDPVEALVIRVRETENATFHAVGKHQRVQPALLEQQVGALERVVGVPNGPSLTKRLSGLSREVGVLDPVFLVSCSRRIKSVVTELALLEQQKRAVDTVLPTEVQARIDALNALHAKHASGIAEVLKPNGPLVVANPQHEAAARVLSRLQALAQQQKLASELLSADGASLKMLSENLVANMQLMKSNISSLQQRLQALNR